MAAEGGEFDAELDDISKVEVYDDDDDSVSVPSEELNRTQPFDPATASTPYHGGERHEMQTMQHEQSGLPDTSYEETPFLTRTGSISDLQNESLLRQNSPK